MNTLPRRQFIRRSLIVASFILFPVTLFYFSPALVIMGAAAGILSGSALVFLAQFLSALLLGRAFCGWICPGAGEQEACLMVQSRRVNGRKCDWIKYLIWMPWMGIILALLVQHGIHSVDFFFMMDSPISISSPRQYPIYLIVTGVIFTLALSVGRRGFCHTACWMAPFLILGTLAQRRLRLPALHLRAEPVRCVECMACTAGCPMSLEVTAMVKRGDLFASECILCGNCIDVCKAGAIGYHFGISRTSKQPRPEERTDET